MSTVVSSVSPMGKLRLREIKELAPNNATRLNGSLNLGPPRSGPVCPQSGDPQSPLSDFSPSDSSLYSLGSGGPTRQAACGTPGPAQRPPARCPAPAGGPDAPGHFCCAQDHVGVCHGDIKGRGGRKERIQPVDCAPGWEEGPAAQILRSCYPLRASPATCL